MKPPIHSSTTDGLFKVLDENGDGFITPEEFYNAVGSQDAFSPSPGETGYIGLPEYRKRAKKAHGTPKEAFDAMDANGNGKVTSEEFFEHCAKLDPPIPKEAAISLGQEFMHWDYEAHSYSCTRKEYYDVAGPVDVWACLATGTPQRHVAGNADGIKPVSEELLSSCMIV